MIVLKSDEEIEKMYKIGQITCKILLFLEDNISAGISSFDIDRMARQKAEDMHTYPAFLGYYGFPKAICVSINDEVVHGIPSKKVIIKKGDLVSLDFGLLYDGFYSDMARTLIVGRTDTEGTKLNRVTQECLDDGIKQAVPGNHISDISVAVENHALDNKFSVVKDYVGHGVGKELHEDPQVPNYYTGRIGEEIVAGMTLAIEPMITEGKSDVFVKRNHWTVATRDHKRSSHFEDSVAITKKGVRILTRI